ncbi:MAG: RpiB/LacA/LacB family sugar-phosphate isomerase [Ginsengibacter sp.]
MKIGIAADHGGFELKQLLLPFLEFNGFEVVDFGAFDFNSLDDYPDFVIPLARALADKTIERGIAICGSGVGACIAANKINKVRACLINDHFSAHQGVEDDDMNMLCLGGRVTGSSAAMEIIEAFLKATFTNAERHVRRLMKVASLEIK